MKHFRTLVHENCFAIARVLEKYAERKEEFTLVKDYIAPIMPHDRTG